MAGLLSLYWFRYCKCMDMIVYDNKGTEDGMGQVCEDCRLSIYMLLLRGDGLTVIDGVYTLVLNEV